MCSYTFYLSGAGTDLPAQNLTSITCQPAKLRPKDGHKVNVWVNAHSKNEGLKHIPTQYDSHNYILAAFVPWV